MMKQDEQQQLVDAIVTALHASKDLVCLTEEERTWVKLAIQKEAQSVKLRRAIIEKTLAGLVWSAFLGLGYILIEWATRHGYKP